jgi:hypothetical protein
VQGKKRIATHGPGVGRRGRIPASGVGT